MAPTHKIAVIQLYPKPMQPDKNFAKACDYVRAAAAQGADLAVLPEYHLTNWLPKDPQFLGHCAEWRKYLEGYQALAKELGICIVPGTIVQTKDDGHGDGAANSSSNGASHSNANSSVDASADASTHDKAHEREQPSAADANAYIWSNTLENVCYFLGRDGSILGKYVKKNLWGQAERAHLLSSGRAPHEVFDTPFGKTGLLVCWDLAFPEAWRELIAQGAKLIVLPMFWTLNDCSPAGLKHNPCAEATFVDATLISRAFENTCAVAMCNAGGPPGRGYMGLSQVTLPFVGQAARLGSCAEGMTLMDVDMQILEDAEENYQVRTDLARDDWHYDYRHTIEDNKSRL